MDEDCVYVNLIKAVVQEEFDKNCFFYPFETFLINSINSNELGHDAKISNCPLLDSSDFGRITSKGS